ncbi:MAG: 2-C-methyl-D-erythritol 4-phosphate cytidylyltransferase [Bacteroidales bacterium]|jgi:2-C-methyl-D-erythritol 4-phosphate cytidylyltransferase|nr:2-C-methyl-D-erythritol 4-phosphate cytidylyltransferase [Bacteroidales bacterium]
MKSTYSSAVIVAGGSGTRMQAKVPKQFMELCGIPVLMHTIKAFSDYDKNMLIVVVLPATQLKYWENLCEQYHFLLPHTIVEGGSNRFESVKNGLSRVPDSGWVAIHDGVRPLVTQATIRLCFQEAKQYGCAIPVIPVTDSVREIKEDRNEVINRKSLRLVQTPQVFDAKQLKEAYLQNYVPEFTDDASVFERKGHLIHLVEGNAENIKITNRQDMLIATALMTV